MVEKQTAQMQALMSQLEEQKERAAAAAAAEAEPVPERNWVGWEPPDESRMSNVDKYWRKTIQRDREERDWWKTDQETFYEYKQAQRREEGIRRIMQEERDDIDRQQAAAGLADQAWPQHEHRDTASSARSEAAAEDKVEKAELVKQLVVFPKLESASAADAAVRCGDWLLRVGHVVKGLTESSSVWWSEVLAEAQRMYGEWLKADAFARVQMGITPVETSAKYHILATKVSAALLDCLSKDIVEVVIQARMIDTVFILFKLLSVYQPGGTQERNQILHDLSHTEKCSTASSAIAALRFWDRTRQRAVEMDIRIPDPYLQWVSVKKISEGVLNMKENSALLHRYNNACELKRIDEVPSEVAVKEMIHWLLAELSQIAIRTEPKADTSKVKAAKLAAQELKKAEKVAAATALAALEVKGKGKGKGEKGKETGKPTPPAGGANDGKGSAGPDGKPACRFYLSHAKGCSRGGQCSFKHDRSALPKDRCRNCGAQDHWSKECTAPRPPDYDPNAVPSGGKKGDKGDKGKGKGDKGKGGGKTQQKPSAQAMDAPAGVSTSVPAPQGAAAQAFVPPPAGKCLTREEISAYMKRVAMHMLIAPCCFKPQLSVLKHMSQFVTIEQALERDQTEHLISTARKSSSFTNGPWIDSPSDEQAD